MFKQKKYILIVVFIVSSFFAFGQRDSTLNREVEVTKTYKPTILDANKINEMPEIEAAEHQPPQFDYNINSEPILTTFSVNSLKAATIRSAVKKDTGYGLIRAGFGNYSKPYGEIFFNNLNSKNSIFGIHASHLSSHGKLKLEGGDKVDAPFSTSEAEIYFKQSFRKSVLSVDFDFKHNGFDYYGYPLNEIPEVLLDESKEITFQGQSQAFSKGGFKINLQNPTAEKDDPVFNFDASYYYFGTKTDQKEHNGAFSLGFQKPLNTGAILGEASMKYVQAEEIFNLSIMEKGKRAQTWVFAKPAWYYAGKTADIRIGINGWFVMDNDKDEVAKVAPNIRVNFIPVKDMIKLYAGADGNYVHNHYSKIAYDNPFVNPLHDVKNSFEKLHLYGGIDGKFSQRTNFKIGVDYSMVDGQPFYFLEEYYFPDPLINPNPLIINNTFNVAYDNIDLLKLNIELFHSSSDKLNLLIGGNYYAYNMETEDEAWNMPEWDANLSIDYKVTSQLSVGADIYLIGSRKALIIEQTNLFNPSGNSNDLEPPVRKIYNLDATFDLNVNANYQIAQNFSAFGQLNNFGFQKYQRWFGYPVQSFNALVGISYSF